MPACTFFLKVCTHSCALGRICTVASDIKASRVSVEEMVVRATHAMWENPAHLEKDQAEIPPFQTYSLVLGIVPSLLFLYQ